MNSHNEILAASQDRAYDSAVTYIGQTYGFDPKKIMLQKTQKGWLITPSDVHEKMFFHINANGTWEKLPSGCHPIEFALEDNGRGWG